MRKGKVSRYARLEEVASMFQVGLDEKLPYDKFKAYLEEGNWIYVDEERLNEAVENIEVKVRSRYQQLVTALFGVTYLKVHTVTKHHIIDYLIDFGVPEEYFCKRGGNDEPIYYNEKVRTKIITNGYACEALWLYEDYNKLKKLASYIRNVVHRHFNTPRVPGNDGQKLVKIPYTVEATKNLRFTTKDENTIGFYGELRSAFTAPEGYYILSCDFPQIDARAVLNMYLKNDRLDELTNQVDDTYLLFKEYARYINHQHDLRELEHANSLDYYVDKEALEKRVANYREEVMPFTARSVRDIYKVTALKTAYYSRHSSIPAENKTMRDLTKMYESTERYKRILSMTTLMFNMNIPIEVSSRWGHRRLIVERDLRATLSSVFNAPIQTTSSEAIIFYVVHFLDYFRERGCGVDDVRICLNRHDEPILYIKKEVFNKHIHFIASMRTFLIEGWAPITLDMFVGDYYKENLDECAELLERVPLETNRALLEAQKFKNQEEPYALLEPKMISMAHRKMEDGSMRVAFVYNTGSFPKDLILDNNYEDRRKFAIKLLSFKTDEDTMTHSLLQQVTNTLSNMIDTDEAFLVLAPYGYNKDILLDKRTSYFRNANGTTAHLIAQAALIALAQKMEPHRLSKDDWRYLDFLEKNKWRVEA